MWALWKENSTAENTHTLQSSVRQSTELVMSQSPTLPPMDCSPPGFPDRGILQARILEWVAISCSKDCKATVIQSNMKKGRKKENKST